MSQVRARGMSTMAASLDSAPHKSDDVNTSSGNLCLQDRCLKRPNASFPSSANESPDERTERKRRRCSQGSITSVLTTSAPCTNKTEVSVTSTSGSSAYTKQTEPDSGHCLPLKRRVTPSPLSSSKWQQTRRKHSSTAEAIKTSLFCKQKVDNEASDIHEFDRDSKSKQDDCEKEEGEPCATSLPDGVIDIDRCRSTTFDFELSPEKALEASYLVSYGAEYYAHLFESDRASSNVPTSLSAPEEAYDHEGDATSALSAAPDEEANDDETATPPFLRSQPHVTPTMRSILADWLVELSHSFQLRTSTVHLAVRLVDRVLRAKAEKKCWGKRMGEEDKGDEDDDISELSEGGDDDCVVAAEWVVDRRMFQCLGCACLLIASKLDEPRPVGTKDLSYLTDDTYTRAEICEMEKRVCHLLEFRLLECPTAHAFAERFLRASDACAGARAPSPSPPNPRMAHMVEYLLELSLLPSKLSPEAGTSGGGQGRREFATRGKGSVAGEVGCRGGGASGHGGIVARTAAAAIYLARATLGVHDNRREIWPAMMVHYTGFDVADLKTTILSLHKCHRDVSSSDLTNSFERFSEKDKLEVALRPTLWEEDLRLEGPNTS